MVKKKKLPNISPARAARLFAGFYLLVFALSQLFSFERFPEVLVSIGFSSIVAMILAIVLVVCEVFALPFLVDMKSSSRLIRVSFWSGLLALVMLSVMEIIAFSSNQTILFGATLNLPGGSWSIMLLIAVWALWLWGVTERYQHTKKLTSSHKRNKIDK